MWWFTGRSASMPRLLELEAIFIQNNIKNVRPPDEKAHSAVYRARDGLQLSENVEKF